jgi:DNA-binding PadR family transcriptional regulator
MTELTPTGRVILGMIALGKQTGYDIKQLSDLAIRHFWAVSYGQLYPELKRLEEQGLIVGRHEPSGGRARQVYDLTEAGRAALRDWMVSPEPPLWEVRCETLLKTFFSDVLAPEELAAQLASFRSVMERKMEQLNAIGQPQHAGPALSLQFGKGMTEWIIDWCRDREQQLGTAREVSTDA